MNKRDFLKSSAALAAAPAILPRTAMAAATPAQRTAMREASRPLGPTPAYAWSSETRTMTFYRSDEATRAAWDYLRRAA